MTTLLLNFGTPDQLTQYTGEILGQMMSVIQPYVDGKQQGYSEHMGPHIRHVIEHYETLARVVKLFTDVNAIATTVSALSCVDYDARERDPLVETEPLMALERIQRLQQSLGTVGWAHEQHMAQPLRVQVRGGVQGEYNFECISTVGRELMFLSSHATHHFAVLQGYANQRGESLGVGLGKAPATVAHENKQREAQCVNA